MPWNRDQASPRQKSPDEGGPQSQEGASEIVAKSACGLHPEAGFTEEKADCTNGIGGLSGVPGGGGRHSKLPAPVSRGGGNPPGRGSASPGRHLSPYCCAG